MLKRIRAIFSSDYSWGVLFTAAVFAAYLYVFLEWLFIVTKPSFFSAVALWQKFRIFVFTASGLALAALAGLGLLFLAGLLLRGRAAQRALKNVGLAGVALIFAALELLLIDNFTYTLFGFGIVSTSGFTTLLYLVGFLLLWAYSFSELKKGLPAIDRYLARRGRWKVFSPALALVVVASFALNFERSDANAQLAVSSNRKNLPNIVWITADGLNAAHTSAYGYKRDTTPRLREFMQHALVAENAFNNAGVTGGSLFSMYTGRYPTQTRLLYSPNILRGKDSYQHLPNILKSLGYYNIQYTYPNHADAVARNLLAGFDEANGKNTQANVVQSRISQYLKSDYAYFIYEIANRIVDRLRHITFNKRMANEQDIIKGDTRRFDDLAKVNRTLEVIREKQGPVFSHIHWMGTHGPEYALRNKVYSVGKERETAEDWDSDFFDDSILDFDAGLGMMLDGLDELGELDSTIIFVGADHSQHWSMGNRLPFVLYFPGGEYQRRLYSNVQNLDLSPTILDYLGVPKPAWMEGTSLLAGEPPARPIFAVSTGGGVRTQGGELMQGTVNPPFFQFGRISAVYCDRYSVLNLGDMSWQSNAVEGSLGACPAGTAVNDAQVYAWMRERLEQDGFDVSSLGDFAATIKR